MESSLYSLFRINIENLVANKAALAKAFHIQPSELEKMPYWEYELFIQKLNDMIKEENDKNKDEEEKYSKYKNFNPNSYKPQMPSGFSTPKMPSIPRI